MVFSAFTNRRFLLVCASLLAALLVGCAGTKIEAIDPAERNETFVEIDAARTASGEEWEEVTIYESGEVGLVSDLYGEEVIAELGQPYEEAVSFEPKLRYNIVYFDLDRSQIRSEGREVLREHAKYLRENPNVKVILEGHTDERGSAGYNIALGGRRVLAVNNFLLAHQVPQEQIISVSYGEERPAAVGNSEEDYAKNRRVEIVYTNF